MAHVREWGCRFVVPIPQRRGSCMTRPCSRPSAAAGAKIHELMRELYPIPRSLTGRRRSARRLRAGLARRAARAHRDPERDGGLRLDACRGSGTSARRGSPDPTAAGSSTSPSRTCTCSATACPMRARLPLAELREHLFTHPDEPGLDPVSNVVLRPRTGASASASGSSSALPDGEYEVCIDATLEDGSVTYGEALVPGETRGRGARCRRTSATRRSANDNLSGIVLLAGARRAPRRAALRYSYRLLFSPGTIGPLSWLSRNEDRGRTASRHGLVASCVGDPGPDDVQAQPPRRRGDRPRGRASCCATRAGRTSPRLSSRSAATSASSARPGSTSRSARCSRTPADEFPGYHSSGDDLELVRPGAARGLASAPTSR